MKRTTYFKRCLNTIAASTLLVACLGLSNTAHAQVHYLVQEASFPEDTGDTTVWYNAIVNNWTTDPVGLSDRVGPPGTGLTMGAAFFNGIGPLREYDLLYGGGPNIESTSGAIFGGVDVVFDLATASFFGDTYNVAAIPNVAALNLTSNSPYGPSEDVYLTIMQGTFNVNQGDVTIAGIGSNSAKLGVGDRLTQRDLFLSTVKNTFLNVAGNVYVGGIQGGATSGSGMLVTDSLLGGETIVSINNRLKVWNNGTVDNSTGGFIKTNGFEMVNGAQASSQKGFIGTIGSLNESGLLASQNWATITGNGSLWQIGSGGLTVGGVNKGTLTVGSGAAVHVDGSIDASNTDTRINSSGTVFAHTLDVSAEAVVTSSNSVVGADAATNGALTSRDSATVTGSNSKWATTGNLTVGTSRNGVLNITSGGEVESSNATIGGAPGSATGSVDVTESFFNVTDTLTVEDTGFVNLDFSLATIDTLDMRGGKIDLSNLGIVDTQLLIMNGGTLNQTAGTDIKAGGLTLRSGTNHVVGMSIGVPSGAPKVGSRVRVGPFAVVDGNVTLESDTAVLVGSEGVGVLQVDPGGTLDINLLRIGGIDGTATIANGGKLVSSNSVEVIQNGKITAETGGKLSFEALNIAAGGQVDLPDELVLGASVFGSVAGPLDFLNLQIDLTDVSGVGAVLNSDTALLIGDRLTGDTLKIRDGGKISAPVINIGGGKILVTDPDDCTVVGGCGPGGSGFFGSAEVLVTGAGSLLTTTGTLTLGNDGTSIEDFNPRGFTGRLTVADDATINADGGIVISIAGNTLDVTGGTVTSNTIDNKSGGTLNLAGGAITADTIDSIGGTFSFTGGTLAVDTFVGDLNNQGGTLAPGESPGMTLVQGTYSQDAASTLAIEIAGVDPGVSYDQLILGIQFSSGSPIDIIGTANLDGLLDVELLGYTPSAGDVFDVVKATTINGDFAAMNLPTLLEDLFWQTGVVDVESANQFPGSPTIFDQAYRLEVVAVPEPATLALLGLGVVAMVGRRRRDG